MGRIFWFISDRRSYQEYLNGLAKIQPDFKKKFRLPNFPGRENLNGNRPQNTGASRFRQFFSHVIASERSERSNLKTEIATPLRGSR